MVDFYRILAIISVSKHAALHIYPPPSLLPITAAIKESVEWFCEHFDEARK